MNEFEQEMVRVIGKHHPFSDEEVVYCYNELKSWDMVLLAIKIALAINYPLPRITRIMK